MFINGRKFNFDNEITVEDMLNELKLDKNKVVVEVNSIIIAKDQFEAFKLKENDSIEVVSFVGGG